MNPKSMRMALTRLRFMVGLVLTLTCASAPVYANQALTITPEQCVALTQGQKCYVDATLKWQLPDKGNYCLYSSQQKGPLFCWQQKEQGSYKAEFVSMKNIDFSLKQKNGEQVHATQQLKVTWVHQKRGKPRLWWRIF